MVKYMKFIVLYFVSYKKFGKRNLFNFRQVYKIYHFYIYVIIFSNISPVADNFIYSVKSFSHNFDVYDEDKMPIWVDLVQQYLMSSNQLVPCILVIYKLIAEIKVTPFWIFFLFGKLNSMFFIKISKVIEYQKFHLRTILMVTFLVSCECISGNHRPWLVNIWAICDTSMSFPGQYVIMKWHQN